jgi:hypothetical protein
MSDSFLFHKGGRWFWLNLTFLVICTVAYVAHEPLGGPSGGTVLGYALGVFAFAGILYLLWYGVRKRSYHSSGNTLKACLSAHVWLGVSLALIVPLHAGFRFGFDVHTLAYVLMMLVILSGVYGAIEYVRSAPLIAAHRGGGHTPALLESIDRLSKEIAAMSDGKSDQFHRFVQSADFLWHPSLWRCLFGTAVPALTPAQMNERLSAVPDGERDDALKVVGIVSRKRELAERLQSDVRVLARLKLWLWVHVPVSLALLFAVIIHILLVFWYW